MHPYDFIDQLKAISGTNDKLAFFKANTNPLIERVFDLALSTEWVFGIKKIPDYPYVCSDITLEQGLEMLELDFATNAITGNARVERLASILASMDPKDAAIIKMVINKKLDCGVSVTNANKCMTRTIPTFDTMLCAKQEQKLIDKLDWPNVMLQTKMDGTRVIISVDQSGNVRYRTRSGKDFRVNDSVDSYFTRFRGIVFDGEMLVADGDSYLDRKTGNGIVNSVMQGKASDVDADRIRFVLWDLIDYDDYFEGHSDKPYITRFEQLYGVSIEAPSKYWSLVETKYPTVFDEAQELYKQLRADGHEGAIIKDMNATWSGKRVNHQIKMKAEETLDLRVIDYVPGTGKYQGMLGSLICTDESGKLEVGVGSGFDDNERKTITRDSIIGKIIEVKYNEVIDKKDGGKLSLFLPIFVDIRDDKTTGDSL